MNLRPWGTAFLLGFAVLVGTDALALPRISDPSRREAVPKGGFLEDRGITPAHLGFRNFCDRYSDQCTSDGKGSSVELDADKWQELVDVNDLVNGRVEPDRDGTDYDNWSLEATRGHCNEYAVQKRKELVDRGWPIAALSLAVVHTRFDAGKVFHLVLTVRTDRGDFVLDNLRDRILPATRTGYGFMMRQSTIHPRLWVRTGGSRGGGDV